MTRFHHRIKTHSAWRVRQPRPGTYLWRSPHGYHYLVDHTGTHPLDPAAGRLLWDLTSSPVDATSGDPSSSGSDAGTSSGGMGSGRGTGTARLADAGTELMATGLSPEMEILALLHRESTLEATFDELLTQRS